MKDLDMPICPICHFPSDEQYEGGIHPDCDEVDLPALRQDHPTDYTLVTGDSFWVTITDPMGRGDISVYVRRTDEGVAVDLLPKGHEMEAPLAECYAYFAEAGEDDEGDDDEDEEKEDST